ncbi:MAG: formylglycine-generating enzyme family protein [Blastocatellia bacterium]
MQRKFICPTYICKLFLFNIAIILVTNLATFAQEAPRISASKSSSTTTIQIRKQVDIKNRPAIATGATIKAPPIPKEDPPLKVEMPEMVQIAGGSFMMGVANSKSDDGPEHLTIVNSFEISKYPITNKEFRQFATVAKYKTEAETNPTDFERKNKISWQAFATKDRDNHPVVWISYNDVKAYCAWLNKVVKNPPVKQSVESEDEDGEITQTIMEVTHPYRIPTEAEWEYAARGNLKGQPYPWGAEADKQKINYNFDSRPNTIQAAKQYIKAVGYQPPNSFGVQDLVGNVAQWCYDWYDESFYEYSPEPPLKAYGPLEGKERVVRGGSWIDELGGCRVSSRQSAAETTRTAQVSFRILRVIPTPNKTAKSTFTNPYEVAPLKLSCQTSLFSVPYFATINREKAVLTRKEVFFMDKNIY